MAKYQNRITDEVTLFIQEPEEELAALRFISKHKPEVIVRRVNLWNSELLEMTLTEQAGHLGLRGGYGLSFHECHRQGEWV